MADSILNESLENRSRGTLLSFISLLAVGGILGSALGYGFSYWERHRSLESFSVYKDYADMREKTKQVNDPRSEDGKGDQKSVSNVICNVVNGAHYYFGSMDQNQTLEHDFIIRNDGSETLEIRMIERSCKCTNARNLSEDGVQIQPGEEYSVTLSWHPTDTSEHFKQFAKLRTNDPARSIVQLEIEGRVIQPLRSEPATLTLSAIPAGTEFATSLRIFSYKAKEFQLTKLEWSNAESAKFFDVESTPLSAEDIAKEREAKSGYRLVVKIKPGLAVGGIKQSLKVTTDIPNQPAIEIPIEGKIQGQISVLPIGGKYKFFPDTNRLVIGSVKVGVEAQARLNLIVKGEAASKSELSVDPEGIFPRGRLEASFESATFTGTAKIFPLVIKVPASDQPIDLMNRRAGEEGKITIKSNLENSPVMEIVVSLEVIK